MENYERYVGAVLDNRYRIEKVIGIGGMAVVFKAVDMLMRRNVAVKILKDDIAKDEQSVKRFINESKAVSMLSHPNIVNIYDVSMKNAEKYIVMEYIEGITLKNYMTKKGVLSLREIIGYTEQVLRALEHAHAKGIVHRDIKPQNIMLLKDGTIKVADFGIAALENEIEESGQAVGSIHYIAPEQARGENPDARSDIYSLGVVMYEMLTGHKPYTGDTIGEIAVKHMSALPVAPSDYIPDLPEELERITLKAMSCPINKRYQSANELLDELNAFSQAQLVAENTASFEYPAVAPVRSVGELPREKFSMRRRRSSTVAFMSGVFGGLLLILALFIFLWNFWLEEVFSPAERIPLPNFVGSSYDAIVNNADLASTYNFKVTYIIDTNSESGKILSQNPEPGRSMMLTPDGISVELSVSTGVVLTAVPDVAGIDYREAILSMQNAGFTVEVENATSSTVPKDNVISTSPAANEQISAGSTVYLVVSSGEQVSYVSTPNFVGLTEEAAIAKISNSGLTYGGSEPVSSEYDAGTVIGQSPSAFQEIEEHGKVTLRVSTGS